MQNRAESFEYHSSPSTEGEPKPKKSRGCIGGCAGCLGVALAVPLAIILIAYLAIFHSSMPLKWAAGLMTEDDPSFQMQGISGSIAKGFSVKKIRFDVKPEGTTNAAIDGSTIEGLTFRYNGFWKAIQKKEFVIKEFSATRMDISLPNDFFAAAKDTNETDETSTDIGTDEDPMKAAETNDPLRRFELKELNFADNHFRTANGEFDLEVPLIRLTGLVIEDDDFELATLEVVSDCLNLELLDAAPDRVEGHLLPFKRMVKGRILPKIHPLVKSPIDFSVEFASIDGETQSRITAFGGAFQHTPLPNGSSLARANNLTISDYLDCDNHITPERLTFTSRDADDASKVEGGELFLGKTRFVIAEQELDTEDPESALLATAQVGSRTVRLRLQTNRDSSWPPFMVTLESDEAIANRELLSLVYFQRAYTDLAAGEKARIDKLSTADTP